MSRDLRHHPHQLLLLLDIPMTPLQFLLMSKMNGRLSLDDISILYSPQQHFHHTRPAHTDIHLSNLSILEDIPDHLPPYLQYTHHLFALDFFMHIVLMGSFGCAALISIAV